MLNNCIAPCGHNGILQLQKRAVYLPRFHRLGQPGTPLQRSISTCLNCVLSLMDTFPQAKMNLGCILLSIPTPSLPLGPCLLRYLSKGRPMHRGTGPLLLASWYSSSLASAGLAMIIRDSHSFYQGFSHFLSWRFRLLPPKLESCSKRYRMVLPAQTLFGTLFQSILVSCHPLHSRIQMNSLTDLTRYKYPRGGDFQSDCGTGSRYHHYPLFLYPWNNHSCRISHYS